MLRRPSFPTFLPLALVLCAAGCAHVDTHVDNHSAVDPSAAPPKNAAIKARQKPAIAAEPKPAIAALKAPPSEIPVHPQSSGSQPPTLELDSQAPHTLDLITRPDDIWVRIRNGFAVPNIDTPLVAQQQAWFLSHPDYLQRAVGRSSRYLYHVVEELEKRGMPTELALLPFIESAYNPMAYSSAQASGMWQFIPSTGKDYKLKQNWWQDERRDVLASTEAALGYLQYIYEMHGDWHLALASYNWGEGAVKRAIEKNLAAGLPTDYLHLTMPEETRNYLPKLQAVKNILANPGLFGIELPKIVNRPYFAAISKTQDIDLSTVARLARMSIDDVRALNPSFNRPVIPGSSATLLLPADRIELFQANLEHSDQPLATWQAYTVENGELLSQVAARFDMSLPFLRQVNGIRGNPRLRRGATLLVQNAERANNETSQLAAVNVMQARVLDYTPPKALRARGKARVASRIAMTKYKNIGTIKISAKPKRTTLALNKTVKIASAVKKSSFRKAT